MHEMMAETLETVLAEIRAIKKGGARQRHERYSRWPMIVLRTPKGWTGPKEVDGHKIEDFWRAHQVPFDVHGNPAHLRLLEDWMRSYRPEELFDATGRLNPSLKEMAPSGPRRLSANPVTNGGVDPQGAAAARFPEYAVEVRKPGTRHGGNTGFWPSFLRDVMARNMMLFGSSDPMKRRPTGSAPVFRGEPEDMDARNQAGGCGWGLPFTRRPGHGDAERAHPRRLA